MGAVQSWLSSYNYEVLSLDNSWRVFIPRPIPLANLIIADNKIVMNNYCLYKGNLLLDFVAYFSSITMMGLIVIIVMKNKK